MSMSEFDPKTIPLRTKILLVTTVLMALGFGYYKLEYEGSLKTIKSMDSNLREVNETLAAYQTAVMNPNAIVTAKANLETTKREIDRLTKSIDQTKSKMQEKYLAILRKLKREAELHGTVLRSFQSYEKDKTSGTLEYKEIQVNMTIRSDYNSLIRFVESLESIPAIISLEHVETSRLEEILPQVESRLRMELYVL